MSPGCCSLWDEAQVEARLVVACKGIEQGKLLVAYAGRGISSARELRCGSDDSQSKEDSGPGKSRRCHFASLLRLALVTCPRASKKRMHWAAEHLSDFGLGALKRSLGESELKSRARRARSHRMRPA